MAFISMFTPQDLTHAARIVLGCEVQWSWNWLSHWEVVPCYMYNLPTNGVKTLLVKLLQVRRLLDYRYGFRLPVSQIELILVKSICKRVAKSLYWVPHLCTRIWVDAMIVLFKKPLLICQSSWREICCAFAVIHWVHREETCDITSPW